MKQSARGEGNRRFMSLARLLSPAGRHRAEPADAATMPDGAEEPSLEAGERPSQDSAGGGGLTAPAEHREMPEPIAADPAIANGETVNRETDTHQIVTGVATTDWAITGQNMTDLGIIDLAHIDETTTGRTTTGRATTDQTNTDRIIMDQNIADDINIADGIAPSRQEAAADRVVEEIRIARLVSVSGTQMTGLLDEHVGSASGGMRPMPQIGDVMKVMMPKAIVFALVTGLEIAHPERTDRTDRAHEQCLVKLELFGEIERGEGASGAFQRGVSAYPSLHEAIYRATSADMRRIYVRPEVPGARIGSLQQDDSLPAYVIPNDLLGKHFAILGTTGSGKSCAVAVILRAILTQHRKAHIIVIDPHNEYGEAFSDLAEVIRPDTLDLPYWLLNAEELAELIIGSDARDALSDRAILNHLVTRARLEWPQNAPLRDQITVDTPVPYRLSDILKFIDETLGKLDKPADMSAYLRIRERLHQLQADRRYAFMFPRFIVRDNMEKILSRLFRIPVDDKPMSILDISSIPSEVLNVVASLLFRMTFDFALWTETPMPMLLVCEEAHRYAPNDSQSVFEPTKRGLMRIAKEGRKYGVSLCMVSQRPSELATTVLSQCNTIFALRMTSQKDQDFLAAALPESSLGLMAELPALRGGEAIAVGEGVPVPARIRFDRLPQEMRPRSQTAPFAAAWSQDLATKDFVQDTLARWRGLR